MIFNKIITKLVDKYYEDNKAQLQKIIEKKLNIYVEKRIILESKYLPYRMTDDYMNEHLENIIRKVVNDRVNYFKNNIKNGINEEMIYIQVEEVLKQRVNDIVECEYKEKINSVIKEILDKIKK